MATIMLPEGYVLVPNTLRILAEQIDENIGIGTIVEVSYGEQPLGFPIPPTMELSTRVIFRTGGTEPVGIGEDYFYLVHATDILARLPS